MKLAPGHGGFVWLQLNLKLGEVPQPRFDPARPRCQHLAKEVRTLGAGARVKKGRAGQCSVVLSAELLALRASNRSPRLSSRAK